MTERQKGASQPENFDFLKQTKNDTTKKFQTFANEAKTANWKEFCERVVA